MDEPTIGDFPLPRLIARGSLIQPTEHVVIYEPPQRVRFIYIIDSTWKPLGLGFH